LLLLLGDLDAALLLLLLLLLLDSLLVLDLDLLLGLEEELLGLLGSDALLLLDRLRHGRGRGELRTLLRLLNITLLLLLLEGGSAVDDALLLLELLRLLLLDVTLLLLVLTVVLVDDLTLLLLLLDSAELRALHVTLHGLLWSLDGGELVEGGALLLHRLLRHGVKLARTGVRGRRLVRLFGLV